jgi:hypothetical protein
MTAEEFNANYTQALDAVLVAMAENEEIDPERFYSIACLVENMRFFSPVLYSAIKKPEK